MERDAANPDDRAGLGLTNSSAPGGGAGLGSGAATRSGAAPGGAVASSPGLVAGPSVGEGSSSDDAGSAPDERVGAVYAFYAERARRRRRESEAIQSPRELVLLWCLWLLGAWVVIWAGELASGNVWGLAAPGAVRWLVCAAVVGLMALWPAYRLSQGSLSSPQGPEGDADPQAVLPAERLPGDWRLPPLRASLVLRDWFCLMLVLQAVLWTLRVTARWTIEQAAWLNAALGAWSLLSAAVIAWGCRSPSGWRRTEAMALCLLMPLVEPLAMAFAGPLTLGLGGEASWLLQLGPFQAVWFMTGPGPVSEVGGYAKAIPAVAILAGLAWLGLALTREGPRR